MMLSKGGVGVALQQVTAALDHVDISIPSQKGGVMKYFEVQLHSPVVETVLNSGGDFWLHNSSADWAPLHGVTGSQTTVTEGGGVDGKPMRYYVTKELPGNSHAYADYRPYDDQSQSLELVIFWELGAKITEEHFIEIIHPLKASAVTSVARVSPGNLTIPGGKGGELVAIYDMPWGALETAVSSGGLRELICDAYDIEPCHKYTTFNTSIGASGGGPWLPDWTPYQFKVPDNAVFTSYYTPRNDQSQTLSTALHWKRAVRHRVVK